MLAHRAIGDGPLAVLRSHATGNNVRRICIGILALQLAACGSVAQPGAHTQDALSDAPSDVLTADTAKDQMADSGGDAGTADIAPAIDQLVAVDVPSEVSGGASNCAAGFTSVSVEANQQGCFADAPVWGLIPLNPSNNMKDNGDGTVSDSQTKLQWEKTENADDLSWTDGNKHCHDLVLAGKTDWRLPTASELRTLVDWTVQSAWPKLPMIAKPLIAAEGPSWSATSYPGNTNIWALSFFTGEYNSLDTTFQNRVRCVRQAAAAVPPTALDKRFAVDATAGTVHDALTSLTWQRDGGASGINNTWAGAKSYCSQLTLHGGGWRLPEVTELWSIVDVQKVQPAIDADAFPNSPFDFNYWTATTYGGNGFESAFLVSFDNGFSFADQTSTKNRARCVK